MAKKSLKTYDLSLFETKKEDKLKDNILKLSSRKLKLNSKKGLDFQTVVFLSLVICIATGICANLIKTQVELSGLTSQIYNKNKELEQEKNEETSIRIKLDSNLSLKEIEEYSKNVLKMQKAIPGQIEYISTKSRNKAEVLK